MIKNNVSNGHYYIIFNCIPNKKKCENPRLEFLNLFTQLQNCYYA